MPWLLSSPWHSRSGSCATARPSPTRRDRTPERRLTPRGEEQSRAAGDALARLEIPIHAVFSSPKVRAWDTARIACEALSVEVGEHKPLVEATTDDVLELMAGHPDNRILLVGHNPSFEQVIYDLTGARVDLRKGAVAGVRVRGRRGELLSLLQPRELALLAQ